MPSPSPGHPPGRPPPSGEPQTTPLERSIDPPGRSPFSWTTTEAPSSVARAAAARPPKPAPATTSSTALDERERRLVVDVLELDPLRPPDEDRGRVSGGHG